MPTRRQPRSGSLQYWPRKRAKRPYARVRNFPKSDEPKLLGFIGYKVGMTHIQIMKESKGPKKTMEPVSVPVTIVECPAVKIAGVRFYKKTTYGLKLDKELWTKVDKNLKRKVNLASKQSEPNLSKVKTDDFDEVRVLIYSQPKLTNIGKKKPELLEMQIGGKKEDQLKYIIENLGKEIILQSIFEAGELTDILSITKGKGFQGTTKRFGTSIRPRKSEKNKRGAGNLGAWTPKKVPYTAPQPGKMGFHQRTEYNKQIMKISSEVEEVNQAGGLMNYGKVKNTFALIKGSVSGAKKRAVVMRKPIRAKEETKAPVVEYISNVSKQGR